jgi:hypothetical protein
MAKMGKNRMAPPKDPTERVSRIPEFSEYQFDSA